MKRNYTVMAAFLSAAFLAGYVIPLSSRADTSASNDINDIRALSKANVGDDIILSQINATHTVYHLTAAQIVELKNEGVSQKVIGFMISTGIPKSSVETTTTMPAPTTTAAPAPSLSTAPPPPPANYDVTPAPPTPPVQPVNCYVAPPPPAYYVAPAPAIECDALPCLFLFLPFLWFAGHGGGHCGGHWHH